MIYLLNNKTKINILIGLFLLTILIWFFVFYENNQDLNISFFDVGQGDSVFIELGDKQILIDGGPNSSVLEKLGRDMAFYDRYIDLIVLTHPESDHITGIIEVIKRYDVGAIIFTGIKTDTNQYEEFLSIIEKKNIPIYIGMLGGEIEFNNASLKILYPFESLLGKRVSKVNNSSIVSMFNYKDIDVLFTGDIEKVVEKELINSGLDLRADILKVAHHGSKSSSDEEFLKAVNASLYIIQAGKDNKYGHPHQEVIDRMANVLVTGVFGDVDFKF